MDDDIVVTEEMRRAVRREECSKTGHHFDVVVEMMSDDPTDLICLRCGKRWPVVTCDRT